MKKTCLLALVLLFLLFSACADATVRYQLDATNTIDIEYALHISADDRDTDDYIDAINGYWSDMDFETDVTKADGHSDLVGDKEIQCISKQDAADAFAKLLTDDDSLFYDVTFNYEPDLMEDHYKMAASISLQDIIRQSEAQNLPPTEIENLIDDVNSGTYQLSLSLPGDIESTNADETKENICTWNLQYDEITQISLETILINEENIAKYEGLEDDLVRDQTLIIICGIAGILLVIAIIIMLIVRHRRSVS